MNRNNELRAWIGQQDAGAVFATLAELVGAAVIVTDGDERVAYWSAEAERVTGHAAAEVLGGPCPAGVRGAGAAGGTPERLARADGAVVYVRRASRPLHDAYGVSGVIHVLTLEAPGRTGAPEGPSPTELVELHGIVTREPAMMREVDRIRHLAPTDLPVLVRGEPGTGKERVARAVHLESRRWAAPFIAVDCAAFPAALLEAELFGPTRASFAGAVAAQRALVAQADGGTLFIDEVGALPAAVQARLLRVLTERSYVPVGGTQPVYVDVRVVASTSRGLRDEARDGRVQPPLLAHLRTAEVTLPALRDCPLDVELLTRTALAELNQRGARTVAGCAPAAMRALLDHGWPENHRGLRAALAYAHAVGRGPLLLLDELPPEVRAPSPPRPRHRADPHGAEAERVRAALAAAGGDLDAAARSLGVSRTTFWRMRARAGV